MISPREPAWLGIDGGGTRTVAAYECGDARRRAEGGPGNLRLLSDTQLLALFTSLRAAHEGLPEPRGVAIGMASARLESDRARVRQFAARVWPQSACYATDDLETALAGAELDAAKRGGKKFDALLIALAGTGSCFFGKNSQGEKRKVGGWGHILGDQGSAYFIGLQAMKAALEHFDRDGTVPTLGQRLLRALALNRPEEMSAWVVNATKGDVGALAVEVSAAAERGDAVARGILAAAAASIAQSAVLCAEKLLPRGGTARVVFAGSVLTRNAMVAKRAAALIRRARPGTVVATLETESAWGAVELAKRHAGAGVEGAMPVPKAASPPAGRKFDLRQLDIGLAASPTEQRHLKSMNLDRISTRAAIELFLSEDARIPAALRRESRNIERAVGWIADAFRNGGRLFYVGAGTSGRLGVLDASECPPTFRSDPEMVQGIIAGGQRALWQAVEGAEDDPDDGARVMEARGVTKRDVVVGIASSGRTPFVWGALIEARRRGAKTVLLSFNPGLRIPRAMRPALVIAPDVGPELLTGSTRLRSGTATKLVLNLFTTLAMVRTGKVLSNLMVDVKPSNVKLRDRAVRIVAALTGCDVAAAKAALERSGWVVKGAAARLGIKRRRTAG
jgi:N-acetylmuramic acid 6-phosphate etherase